MPGVMINGPDGRLEAYYAAAEQPDAPIALFLHPHPQHGGTMHNKVIYTLYQSFVSRGFACLRFNFRGVGRSQGSYARGEGELFDAAAAMDWLQQQNEDARECWICGFSFGAWTGLQLLMRRPEISGFVMAAPPVNLYDFSFLAPCPTSGLIVQGEEDTLVPAAEARKLVRRLNQQRDINVEYAAIPDADHFFNKRLRDVSEHVGRYLDDRAAAAPPRPDGGFDPLAMD